MANHDKRAAGDLAGSPPAPVGTPAPAAGDDHPRALLKKIRVSIELRRAVAALHRAATNLAEKEHDRRSNRNTELSSAKRSAYLAERVQMLRANRRVVKAAVAYVNAGADQ